MYKIGEIKTVIANRSNHKFTIGSKVEIIKIPDNFNYLCKPNLPNNVFSHKPGFWYFVHQDDLWSLTDILKNL